jgi:hypothetical protein
MKPKIRRVSRNRHPWRSMRRNRNDYPKAAGSKQASG